MNLNQPREMQIAILAGDRHRYYELAKLFSEAVNPPYKYQMIAVYDVDAAIDIFDKQHPDLIIVDSSIPFNKGQMLSKFVRQTEGSRHTGIMFLYDKSGDIDAVDFLEIGADDAMTNDVNHREFIARANAVLKLKAMTDELRSANHYLQKLSYTDELTGLANMRAFNARYAAAIKSCFEGKHAIGVLMLDLDQFKKVNDSTDHLMGSFVISEVGRLIKNASFLSSDDCAARFGGDEYIIFTTDPSMKILSDKAEQLRKLISEATFKREGQQVSITTSIGVCWCVPGYKGRAEDPIKAADLMLYRSKKFGRNCISCIQLKDPQQIELLSRNPDLAHKQNEHDVNSGQPAIFFKTGS